MKKLLAQAMFAAALAFACGSISLAADIQKTEPSLTPAPAEKLTPEARQQQQLANMLKRFDNLGLTEDQKNQIRPLLKSQLEELRAVRMNKNISDDERQNRAQSIVEGYREQIASILTAEQKAQIQQRREADLKAAKGAGTITRRGHPVEENN
jgi:Spy/CpxP family protein refolding chaperone